MKQAKRVFVLVLTMVMLFATVSEPLGSIARATSDNTASQGTTTVSETPESLLHLGEWVFWVENAQAYIAGYEDPGVRDLKIPAHLNGYPVVGIGARAFSANTALKSIYVPTNVTQIADDAFQGLDDLVISAYHGAYALVYAGDKGLVGSAVEMPGVEFAAGVIDLAGLPADAYADLNETSVVFKAPEATFLTPGQVLYFPADAEYPTGLAVRVETVQESGGMLVVTLSQPEWGDCFERVTGEDELILDWDNAILAEGIELDDTMAAASAYKHSFNIQQKITKYLKMSGKITFDIGKPNATYDIGWRWWGVLRVPDVKKVEVNFPSTTDFSVKFEVSNKPLDPKNNGQGRIMERKTIHIADVPAISVGGVINGYVAIDWALEFGGSVEVSGKVITNLKLTYQNGKVKKDLTRDWQNFSVKVEAEFKTGPQLSAYMVLGWAGFSIRFLELDFFLGLHATGSAKRTWFALGTQDSMLCCDVNIQIEFTVTGKIGLVKLAKHDCKWYESLSYTVVLWKLGNWHFDDMENVHGSSNCTLKNRKLVVTVDGKKTESKHDVGSLIPAPATPSKKGYTFKGWYIDAKASGLSGADIKFDFNRNSMPYCGRTGTCYIYAKFDEIKPTSVTLNKSSETIYVGAGTISLKQTVKPANAANTSVTWTSSNNNVAKVNSNGVVTPVGPGTATITCTCKGDTSVKATFKVTVKQYVNKLSLSASSDEVFQGNTLQLTATVTPSNASNKALSWATSNASIATVDSNGKVTGVAPGTATITVTAKDRNTVKATFTVHVLVPVTGITLDKSSAVLYTNNTAGLQLNATLTPSNANAASVSWSSSNTSVATVNSSGKVVPVAPGTTTITCRSKSDSNVTATCTITVKQYVTKITLSGSTNEIYQGNTLQLSSTVAPSNATDKSLTWTSSDDAIATVSSSGLVTGVGSGHVVITATANDGSNVSASYELDILLPVTGIVLDQSSAVLYTNNTAGLQLNPSLTPAEASLASVSWESSNTSVATVSSSGKVLPVAPGTVTITCRSKSDSSVTATCTVTVKQYVQSISLSGEFASLAIGDTMQLSSTVGPNNATDKSLDWSSSNNSIATVSSSGVITGVGGGTAIITATAHDGSGVSASFRIVVVPNPSTPPAVEVTGVSAPSTMTVYTVHRTAQINATVSPSTADQSVIWTSGNENIATIDNTGKITMVAAGTTILTVRSAADPHKYANCTLRVVQSVETITISGETHIEQAGGTTALTVTVLPTNAENRAVTWSSSNTSVATVSSSGVVTGVANGVAKITATAKDGSGISSYVYVRVGREPVDVESITLDLTEINAYTNELDGVVITPTVLPEFADNTSVIWSSSDEEVATVDSTGRVHFTKPGTTIITCRSVSNSNVTATCTVTVNQYVEQIVVTCSNAILLPGETTQATAAVYPTDATNRSVTWSSSNPAVATVNQSGLVTAVAAGEAEIIATANDGSDAEGSYLLTVEKQLQINVSVVNDTVFTQGSDPCDLAYFNLTPASAARMAQAGYTPAWTMTRTAGSGDASLSEFSTSLSRNGNNYTTTAALLGGAVFPDAGTETYVITCSAGPYEESVEINVTVDGTVYAEAVKLTDASLGYNTLTTQIDEAVTLPYTPYSADSNPVPQNMDVSVFGNTLYNDHAFELYSEDGLEVSFDESCSYAARVIYRKGNLSYTVNAVFNVADENGVIRLRVDDIAIDKAFVSLAEGESAALTATVTPNDAYNKAVTWSSSDPSVATVSADGLVTAVAPGLAVISCTATDGSGVAGICTVSVEDFLQLDEDQLAFTVYTDGQDHANLGTINVTLESQKRLTQNGMNVKWTLERLSSDSTELGVSEYAAAAEDGLSVSGNLIKLLRVKSAGTDTYRLTCASGNYSDSCLITVTAVQGNLPSAVTLATTNYTTRIGEWIEIDTSCTLTPNGSELPEDAEMFIDGGNAFRNALSMLYSYAEPEKLSFDTAGTFTANVVFSGSNYRYECPITIAVADEDDNVPANITDVIVSEEELLLVPGQSFTLSASVLPANASHSAISWTSSDTSVATVNSSTGKVTAIGPGYASIVASVPESDYQGSCLVYVEQGINFRDDEIERTVFVDGETRMALDTVMLTDSTSARLSAAPAWTLSRVSGISLTLRANPIESVNAQGTTLYGCELTLYSVSKEGDTVYELSCSNGEETKTITITVHAVYRDRLLPASISLDETVFTADVGELIVLRPVVTTYPAGTSLPNGIRVSCEGGTQYQEALIAEDSFVSQSLSTFAFSRPGTYPAKLIYAYSNMKYVVPVTFRIRDENGDVPVQASRMSLNERALYLTAGETASLEAVFTPADATDQAVVWASSDPSVATVDANGLVTAVANGTAYISCDPSDPECDTVECAVTVEDYLTVEAGQSSRTLYVQGEQSVNVAGVQLSEGTIERLAAAGITPVWTVSTEQVSHAVLNADVSDEAMRVLINTDSLLSGGTDRYTVSCTAGEYSWSQQYTLTVVDLGATAPQSVTIRNAAVSAAVGEAVTIDFSPVIYPSGASMPSGMIDTGFVGVGNFYNALDMDSYAENGDLVTVAFTKPGQYLLTRRYLLSNLQYVLACTITVGGEQSGRQLLRATETEFVVYSGGRSGSISTVSISDAVLYQLYRDSVSWSVERIFGDSLTVALKEYGDSVDVFVAGVEKNGTDVWRVTCSFGGMSEYVDITITADDPRGPLPESISLANDRLSGMIGNTIYLPLGVSCSPSGSMLPDKGDEFWSFSFDQAGEERSYHSIENGMLQVRFTTSGYYTGNLSYRSGNVSYSVPVYFVIMDEEEEVRKPSLELFAVNTFDTVYPEGATGVAIGQMVMAESLSSYSTGASVAFMQNQEASWTVTKSGSAAALSLRKVSANVYELVLDGISGTGDVSYTVSCTVDGRTYTVQKSLHVASDSEPRPDPTLLHTSYQTSVGERVLIDSRLYSRQDGSILQAASALDASNLLAAVGYEIEENSSEWSMVFYSEGTYNANVSAQVSNLTLEVPIVIVVGPIGSEPVLSVLSLPANLTTIKAEAFEGIAANVIDLRGTKVTSIGAGAFRNCVDVCIVYLPDGVTSIADDAFYGCLNAKFVCSADSYAATWAEAHQIPVVNP